MWQQFSTLIDYTRRHQLSLWIQRFWWFQMLLNFSPLLYMLELLFSFIWLSLYYILIPARDHSIPSPPLVFSHIVCCCDAAFSKLLNLSSSLLCLSQPVCFHSSTMVLSLACNWNGWIRSMHGIHSICPLSPIYEMKCDWFLCVSLCCDSW